MEINAYSKRNDDNPPKKEDSYAVTVGKRFLKFALSLVVSFFGLLFSIHYIMATTMFCGNFDKLEDDGQRFCIGLISIITPYYLLFIAGVVAGFVVKMGFIHRIICYAFCALPVILAIYFRVFEAGI